MGVPKKKLQKKVRRTEGTISVSKTLLGHQESSSEKIKVRPFLTETANVGVKYGMTIPMGDYSSARIDIMINAPCYVEEMLEVFKQCSVMADDLLSKEIQKVKGEEK